MQKGRQLPDGRATESGAARSGPILRARRNARAARRHSWSVANRIEDPAGRSCGRVGPAKRHGCVLKDRGSMNGCNPTPDKFDINGPRQRLDPHLGRAPTHGPRRRSRLRVPFASF